MPEINGRVGHPVARVLIQLFEVSQSQGPLQDLLKTYMQLVRDSLGWIGIILEHLFDYSRQRIQQNSHHCDRWRILPTCLLSESYLISTGFQLRMSETCFLLSLDSWCEQCISGGVFPLVCRQVCSESSGTNIEFSGSHGISDPDVCCLGINADVPRNGLITGFATD